MVNLLLSTGYKIIAKMLTMWLQLVVPNIINNDQSVYFKEHYIWQNVRILEDISFFTKQNQLLGILLFIDFERLLTILTGTSSIQL